jgi:hypothetical protein
MTSKATYGQFKDILAMASPELRPVCVALRKLIENLDKDVVEIVWLNQKIASYGIGPKKMTEHYAYIAVQGSHVNLGLYHGTSLADPNLLLEGTGKELRHIKLREASAVKSKAITDLIRQAITNRKQLKG